MWQTFFGRSRAPGFGRALVCLGVLASIVPAVGHGLGLVGRTAGGVTMRTDGIGVEWVFKGLLRGPGGREQSSAGREQAMRQSRRTDGRADGRTDCVPVGCRSAGLPVYDGRIADCDSFAESVIVTKPRKVSQVARAGLWSREFELAPGLGIILGMILGVVCAGSARGRSAHCVGVHGGAICVNCENAKIAKCGCWRLRGHQGVIRGEYYIYSPL